MKSLLQQNKTESVQWTHLLPLGISATYLYILWGKIESSVKNRVENLVARKSFDFNLFRTFIRNIVTR